MEVLWKTGGWVSGSVPTIINSTTILFFYSAYGEILGRKAREIVLRNNSCKKERGREKDMRLVTIFKPKVKIMMYKRILAVVIVSPLMVWYLLLYNKGIFLAV